jgi:zinc protease
VPLTLRTRVATHLTRWRSIAARPCRAFHEAPARSRRSAKWLAAFFLLPLLYAPVARLSGRVAGEAPQHEGLHEDAVFRSLLPNGLRLVIAPDHAVSLVAVSVVYGVGSNDDPPGRDDLAHLLEHLMFRGSRHVRDGEHEALVTEAGGYGPGATRQKTSTYTSVLPSNQLELLLFLEADRMRGLQLTPASIESEKLTVQNERGANLRFDFPSRFLAGIAGSSRQQLHRATLPEVQAFYDRYYGPNNAVLAIVGDVKPSVAAAHVRRYFSEVEPLSQIERPATEARGGRHLLVQAARKTPQIFLAYPVSQRVSAEAIRVLISTLSDPMGQSLRRRVEQRGVITGTLGIAMREVAEGTFIVIDATPSPTKTIDDVEAAIVAELSRVDSISAPDFERVRNGVLTRHARDWLFPDYRAERLAETELVHGDARRVLDGEKLIRALGPSDVQNFANDIFAKGPQVVVTAVQSK